MKLPHKTLVCTLKQHAEALALPKGRRVGQPGHAVACDYLLGQMERIGLEPFHGGGFELCYEGLHPNTQQAQKFTNLVGVIPGKDRALPPILLGAHYDSVIDAPCVDDNATSVAHNLVLADHFAPRTLERDLIVAFFDAEEPPFFLGPCMGSRRFVEDHCQDREFAAAIVTDLVGHDATDCEVPDLGAVKHLIPGLKQLVGVMGAESDGTFPAIVEAAAGETGGLKVITTLHEYVGPVSDHAAFADAGHPFLFLSCGMGRHYHSPQDTMDWINFDKLAGITRFIAALVVRIDATPSGAVHTPRDCFDTDLRLLKKALGLPGLLALKALGKSFGIALPETREEMTSLVRKLL